MKFGTAAAALALAFGTAAAGSAGAAPGLHGFCNTQCIDNSTNSPTSIDPPEFGFTAGGHSERGAVTIDILVPDNDALPTSYTISGVNSTYLGGATFTATELKSTAWTSGDLDSYLGITASPANPIGAYLTSTQKLDAGATGFYVFQANLGDLTLPSNSGANNSDLMKLAQDLFRGSYIVAFQHQDGGVAATINSGAIFETGGPGVPEPATWAMMILGVAMIGFAARRRRDDLALAA